jgi:hypothetical protein
MPNILRQTIHALGVGNWKCSSSNHVHRSALPISVQHILFALFGCARDGGNHWDITVFLFLYFAHPIPQLHYFNRLSMNQEHFTLMLLLWNVRGLSLKEKHNAVMDTIAISHPHIVCIESKLRAIDSATCKSFLPSYLSNFSFSPSEVSRGGPSLHGTWTLSLLSRSPIATTT